MVVAGSARVTMTASVPFLAFAAVFSFLAAGILIWAAVLIQLRVNQSRHHRETYRASDSTIPAARR